MLFVNYQDVVSPHVAPLFNGIMKILGESNVRYVYRKSLDKGRVDLGWQGMSLSCAFNENGAEEVRDWLRTCLLMFSGLKEFELFECRTRGGLKTIYSSERWFKSHRAKICGISFILPWGVRLVSPRYFKTARRIVRLLKAQTGFKYAAVGVHAAADMARLVGLFSGDLRCLFIAPKLRIEKKPFGRIYDAKGKLIPWMFLSGYFVEPTRNVGSQISDLKSHTSTVNVKRQMSNVLRVLWVGRMIDWKRVDTLVRAVALANRNATMPITLTLVGDGPEKPRLQKLADKLFGVISNLKSQISDVESQTSNIRSQISDVNAQPSTLNAQPSTFVSFRGSLPISEIRKVMREHDVYVLPSDGGEGWGAVVNEALEEEMCVLGTYEAGASATMLPEENLFHAGDYKKLAEMLQAVAKEIGTRNQELGTSGGESVQSLKFNVQSGDSVVSSQSLVVSGGDSGESRKGTETRESGIAHARLAATPCPLPLNAASGMEGQDFAGDDGRHSGRDMVLPPPCGFPDSSRSRKGENTETSGDSEELGTRNQELGTSGGGVTLNPQRSTLNPQLRPEIGQWSAPVAAKLFVEMISK